MKRRKTITKKDNESSDDSRNKWIIYVLGLFVIFFGLALVLICFVAMIAAFQSAGPFGGAFGVLVVIGVVVMAILVWLMSLRFFRFLLEMIARN